jgi:apurinic endonuclease APN1
VKGKFKFALGTFNNNKVLLGGSIEARNFKFLYVFKRYGDRLWNSNAAPSYMRIELLYEKRKLHGEVFIASGKGFHFTSLKEMVFIGAHVSAAGRVGNSVKNAQDIGANAFALFVRPQRTWTAKPMSQEDIADFKEKLEESSISPYKVVPHGSYLINLCNPDDTKRAQSYELFKDEATRCFHLGLAYYNIHPGSTVGACSVKEAAAIIAKEINRVHEAVPQVSILLENAAGQGNSVGSRFEELKMIIDSVSDKSRIGMCLDTCHMFAAGYDIRSEKAYQKSMGELDKVVGLSYLKAIHLNDSKGELGCGKDRHENIGKGCIGLKGFQHMMTDERLSEIPMILETPDVSPNIYVQEITLLQEMASGKK